tara:strand:- start:672 stop:1283 length:612 start_codon:yes stop_codon:yes gene_type:complete
MIQYHNGIPFCIMQQEEAGVSINFKAIVGFLENMEPRLMSIPNDKNTAYTSNDMSARFNQWNIFYVPEPMLMSVFKLIKIGWKQFNDELAPFGKEPIPIWIHAHGNIHHKDQKLGYHAHKYPVSGYIAISSEGSNTDFYTGENEDIKVSIPNKNGQLVITIGTIPHETEKWDKNYPRCSIAFNLMTRQELSLDGCGPIFPFEV